jgi:exopolyphosphatase/guanosine-5'-triphosphate,3'-diphosphate pyrophosphatase
MARNGGAIRGEAIQRTVACLKELRIEAQAHGAVRIHAAGTEVLRSSSNAKEFLERAGAALGADVEVLSGEREARLAWLGVSGGRYPSRPTALLDVGGGSTEYVRATSRGVLQAMTVPLGAARLSEAMEGRDPASLSRAAADAFVAAGLISHSHDRLVTSGGTATTLAAILRGLRTFDQRRIEGTRMGMADVLGLLNRLCTMTPAERARVPGMERDRVDTIVPGAVILAVALKLLDARETTITTKGLRHGLLIEAFGMSKAD